MKIMIKTLCVTLMVISVANAADDAFQIDWSKTSVGSGFRLQSGTSGSSLLDISSRDSLSSLRGLPPFRANKAFSDDNFLIRGSNNCQGEVYFNNSLNPIGSGAGSLFKANDYLYDYSCQESKKNLDKMSYDVDSCGTAISCSWRYAKNYNVANGFKTNVVLDDFISQDYGRNILGTTAGEMERFDAIKKFAKEKFNITQDSKKLCKDRFSAPTADSCDMGKVEQAFADLQVACVNSPVCMSNFEYKERVNSFQSFKKNNPEGKMLEFFEARTNSQAKDLVTKDKERMQALVGFVNSSQFSQISDDKKAEIFTKLVKGQDPVFNALISSSASDMNFKKSQLFQEVFALLKTKNLKGEEFEKKYDEIRKQKIKDFYEADSTCTAPSVQEICRDMTSLSNGSAITSKSPKQIENNSSKKYMSEDLKRYMTSTYFGASDDDLQVLINARRCNLFGLERERTPNERVKSSTVSESEQKEDVTNVKVSDGGGVPLSDFTGGTFSSGDSKTRTSDEVSEVDDASFSSKFASAVTETTGPITPASGQTNSYNNNMYAGNSFGADDDKKGAADAVEAAKAEALAKDGAPGATANDKMNDYLMKRLAAAEENLEKMKAEAAEKEASAAKQKKMDEEAALIKDLKSQIADLKAGARAEKAAVAAPQVVDQPVKVQQPVSNFSGNASSSLINSRSSVDVSAPKVVPSSENYDAQRSASVSSSGAGIRSIASGSILTSSGNENNRTTLLASGAQLTTVDGLSAEKATLTISNKILELNGTPFLIEEGGLVKEIIPVVKDGKVLLDEKGNPIYEKVVKGKVGDKKFAKASKDKRAPASITDSADLKREEEERLKRERAEYLKLKSLTTKALDGAK